MLMFYGLVVLCLSSAVSAQVVGWGPCPDIDAMLDFELPLSRGTWYEVRNYPVALQEQLRCVTSVIRRDNGTMLVDGSAVSVSSGLLHVVNGMIITTPNADEPGELVVEDAQGNTLGSATILGTDYISYMVSYRCVNWEVINFKYVSIATRDRNATQAVISKGLKVMQKQNLNIDKLVVSDQANCGGNASTAMGIIEGVPEGFNLFL